MKHLNTTKNQHTASYQSEYYCLNGKDVITAQVSDHHPIIHDGVFFWNIMMQGNARNGGLSFNNGFGFIESDQIYLKRLKRVAQVIAEAVALNPTIEVISLCEGPIKVEQVNSFYQYLMSFLSMEKFKRDELFFKPSAEGQNWGLLMLADQSYSVSTMSVLSFEQEPKLTNRFQLWQLTKGSQESYVALGHFPFAGDERKTDKKALSSHGQKYCDLINSLIQSFQNESLIFCADFNFNPYLLSQFNDRALDQINHNNSILLTVEGQSFKQKIDTVTVDGILLSSKEKQKLDSSLTRPGLLARLKTEYRFFQSNLKQLLNESRREKEEQLVGVMPLLV